MPQSPEDKVKRNAMPQTDQGHCCQLTDKNHRPRGNVLIAAYPAVEGIEEIRAEPLRQRHVPVIPELCEVWLGIRRGEVFRQFDADKTPNANGYVGISTKIEIN